MERLKQDVGRTHPSYNELLQLRKACAPHLASARKEISLSASHGAPGSPREPQGGKTFEELFGAARGPQGAPGSAREHTMENPYFRWSLCISERLPGKPPHNKCKDSILYAVAVVRSLVLPAHAGGAVLPVPVVLWIMRVLHAGIVIPMLRSVMLPALIFIALVGHAAVHGCRKESRVGFASARVVPAKAEDTFAHRALCVSGQ